MGSLNKVMLIGYVGRDPERRTTASGQAVCNFSVATSEKWKDKDGNAQEKTEWHRIVAWGKLAEICGQYLSKGKQAYIEGSLETREWTDKDGGKKQTTEIKASQVTFLSSPDGPGRSEGGERRPEKTERRTAPSSSHIPDEYGSAHAGPGDDIPF